MGNKSFYKFCFIIISILFLPLCLFSETVNYLGINQLKFDGTKYQLRWSAISHGSTIIEDFLPHDASYTRFPQKFSLYLYREADFSRLIEEKDYELQLAVKDGQVKSLKRDSISPDEYVYSYVSRLTRGDVTLVAQFSIFHILRKGSEIQVKEWVKRDYDNVRKFEEKVLNKREKWVNEIRAFAFPAVPDKESKK